MKTTLIHFLTSVITRRISDELVSPFGLNQLLVITQTPQNVSGNSIDSNVILYAKSKKATTFYGGKTGCLTYCFPTLFACPSLL